MPSSNRLLCIAHFKNAPRQLPLAWHILPTVRRFIQALPIPLPSIAMFLNILNAPCNAQSPHPAQTPPPFVERTTTSNNKPCEILRDALFPGIAGPQKADLYRPLSDSKPLLPALLLIHGGGWAGGDKASDKQVELAHFAVDEGFVAVSINYSLTKFSGDNPKAEKLRAGWPNNLHDCQAALRWLRLNSQTFGIDPQRVAVVGSSAGGHLALLLALNESKITPPPPNLETPRNGVRCVVDFYGITDVRRFEVYSLLSERDRYNPTILAAASPIEQLSKTSPPILIFHGSSDSDVEPSLSEDFAARARSQGIPCDYVPIEGAAHGFGLTAAGRDLRPILRDFLKKHL